MANKKGAPKRNMVVAAMRHLIAQNSGKPIGAAMLAKELHLSVPHTCAWLRHMKDIGLAKRFLTTPHTWLLNENSQSDHQGK